MLIALAALRLLAVPADDDPSKGVSFEPPASVTSALGSAKGAVDVVGQCYETNQQLEIEPAYAQIESRYYTAIRRAEGIWGNTIFRDVERGMPAFEPVVCQRATILQALKEAELALDNEERAFAQATLAMTRGVWAGPLKLCQDTVLRAEAGFDALTGEPMVLMTLQPGSATDLGSITERSINGPLAIRLDGEIISEPTVLEKIDGGQVQVVGPELPALERLSYAVSRPC